METPRDPKEHPQYQAWRDKVYIRNIVVLAASEQIPTPKLRHEFTNYEDLLSSNEFQQLKGLDRIAAYHAIHYTATVKALKHREFQLAEQRNQLLEKREKYKLAQRELKKLFEEKKIQYDKLVIYNKKLKDANEKLLERESIYVDGKTELKGERIDLEEECDRIKNEYDNALLKIKQLEKELDKEQKYRKRLSQNNQSFL